MPEYQSTKRGKPLRRGNQTGYSFQWFGTDDHGVSIWEGDPKALRFGYLLVKVIGGTQVFLGALFAALGHPAELSVTLFLTAIIPLALSWWLKGLHARLSCLSTPRELAEKLGLEEEDLNMIAAEKGILPKAIINQRPIYDPADFGGAGVLLRAVDQPDDVLLRTPNTGGPADDELLHPADMRDCVDELPLEPAPIPGLEGEPFRADPGT